MKTEDVSKNEWEYALNFFSNLNKTTPVAKLGRAAMDLSSGLLAGFKNKPKKLKSKDLKEVDEYNKAMKEYEQSSKKLHSFIRINGKIYAMDNKPLGVGGFGQVKEAISEDRERVVIKVIKVSRFDIREIENSSAPKSSLESDKSLPESDVSPSQDEVIQGDSPLDIAKNKEIDALIDTGQLGQFPSTLLRRKMTKSSEWKGGKLYIAMPYIEGEDLSKIIKSGDLSQELKLKIAMECCKIVMDLHKKGIIHGDLKPENFKARLNEKNEYVVEALDFGAVQRIKEPLGARYEELNQDQLAKPIPEEEITDPQITDYYAAPEVSENRAFSYVSDTYALGKIFDLMGIKGIGTLDNKEPNQRPSLPSVMKTLNNKLKLDKIIMNTAHLNFEQFKKEYQDLRGSQPTKILFSFKRETINKTRTSELNDILIAFQIVNKDESLPHDKAALIYALLKNKADNISSKSSRMKQFCEDKVDKLEKIFPELKEINIEKYLKDINNRIIAFKDKSKDLRERQGGLKRNQKGKK